MYVITVCLVSVSSFLARALCLVCIADEAVAVGSRLFDLIYTYYSTHSLGPFAPRILLHSLDIDLIFGMLFGPYLAHASPWWGWIPWGLIPVPLERITNSEDQRKDHSSGPGNTYFTYVCASSTPLCPTRPYYTGLSRGPRLLYLRSMYIQSVCSLNLNS